jgi:ATP-dependent 26S proteasome regulatory subunit
MSAEDLEGDDIWGDAAAAAEGESKQDESQQQPPPERLDDDETRHMSISELRQRIHLINNDIRVMKSDVQRITHESRGQRDRIRENQEKVKLNKQLPYLVANVVEILEADAEDGEFSLYCFFKSFSASYFRMVYWCLTTHALSLNL